MLQKEKALQVLAQFTVFNQMEQSSLIAPQLTILQHKLSKLESHNPCSLVFSSSLFWCSALVSVSVLLFLLYCCFIPSVIVAFRNMALETELNFWKEEAARCQEAAQYVVLLKLNIAALSMFEVHFELSLAMSC